MISLRQSQLLSSKVSSQEETVALHSVGNGSDVVSVLSHKMQDLSSCLESQT